ncbi:MAG: TolC family protein, partial [Silvanigrellaceae bacterium]|nr:TolC family protein [Silvanigrellaceae bacterium]
QIGVAVSAYFPNLNLSASSGYSKTSYIDLFSFPALFWTLGASLTETIFDGGLREQKIKAAKANYQAIAAQYKQTVLVAFQNLEDNLAAYKHYKTEEDFQINAANNSKLTEKLINQGYEIGTKTYSDLLNAQITLYNLQKTLNNTNGKRVINTVNIIASLGGIWDNNK